MSSPKDKPNKSLRDSLLRHAHYVIAVEAGLSALINRRLTDALTSATRMLLGFQISPEAAVAYETYRNLYVLLSPMFQTAVQEVLIEIRTELYDLATAEDRSAIALLRNVLPGPVLLALDEAPITPEHANSIVNAPNAGSSLSTRVNGLLLEADKDVQDALDTSASLGETQEQAVERLERYIEGGIKRLLDTLASAEVQRVAAEARQLVFDTNRKILHGVQYVATLDSRTCKCCKELDGNIYVYGTGMDIPSVPRHPFCRCIYSPLVKDWKSLGFTQADIADFPSLARLTGESSRPDEYLDWLVSQPKSVQIEILGQGKYNMLLDGKSKPTSAVAALFPIRIRARDLTRYSRL